MIDIVNVETAHLFQDALAAQHRFRFQHFVERSGWVVPHYNGMEYDQFDTPAAVYLLWRDQLRHVRGMVRLLPTTKPYMLETLWPDLRPNDGLPQTNTVWENTRFAVDATLDVKIRNRVTGELIAASLEFGLGKGINRYLVVSPTWVISRILKRSGLVCDVLKYTDKLGQSQVASAYVHVTSQALTRVRANYGITEAVSWAPLPDRSIAA